MYLFIDAPSAHAQGSSNTVGTASTSGQTFLQQKTSERGGTDEVTRAHGFGVTDTTGTATNNQQSASLVSTREDSETQGISQDTTDALAKNSQSHNTAFQQVGPEGLLGSGLAHGICPV